MHQPKYDYKLCDVLRTSMEKKCPVCHGNHVREVLTGEALVQEAIEYQNGYIIKSSSEYRATDRFSKWFCLNEKCKNFEEEF